MRLKFVENNPIKNNQTYVLLSPPYCILSKKNNEQQTVVADNTTCHVKITSRISCLSIASDTLNDDTLQIECFKVCYIKIRLRSRFF